MTCSLLVPQSCRTITLILLSQSVMVWAVQLTHRCALAFRLPQASSSNNCIHISVTRLMQVPCPPHPPSHPRSIHGNSIPPKSMQPPLSTPPISQIPWLVAYSNSHNISGQSITYPSQFSSAAITAWITFCHWGGDEADHER